MNKLKIIREKERISSAELARNANLSVLTLRSLEKGNSPRLSTQRKILRAVNQLSEKKYTYGDIFCE